MVHQKINLEFPIVNSRFRVTLNNDLRTPNSGCPWVHPKKPFMNAMKNVIQCLVGVGGLVSLSCYAGEVLLSPKAMEFRQSVRRVAEPAPDAFHRGVPAISPRHDANQVRVHAGQVKDHFPRQVIPLSPRAASLQQSGRSH